MSAGADVERGFASLGMLGPVAAALVIALVTVVDVGAYALAASRAQAAADGAALAAAQAVTDPTSNRSPELEARDVVISSGGTLVRCTCQHGRPVVEVIARVRVGGLVISRVWARTVDATARATTLPVERTVGRAKGAPDSTLRCNGTEPQGLCLVTPVGRARAAHADRS